MAYVSRVHQPEIDVAKRERAIVTAAVCAVLVLFGIGWQKIDRNIWKARRDIADVRTDTREMANGVTNQVQQGLSSNANTVAGMTESLKAMAIEIQRLRNVVSPPPLPVTSLPEINIHHGDMTMPFGGKPPASYKKQVPCGETSGPRVMVLLALGQSNAANHGGRMSRSAYGDKVINYYDDGRCYVAEDPLLGGDGDGGSLWPSFANRMIADGAYDKVIVVVHAFGGTGMEEWLADGPILRGLGTRIEAMHQRGVDPTEIVWIQGETERYGSARFHSDADGYRAALDGVLLVARRYAPAARAFIATASSCPNQADNLGPTPAIRRAQIDVLSEVRRIFAGPDLDSVTGFKERFDNCHLTGNGLANVEDQLVQAFRRADTVSPPRASIANQAGEFPPL